MRLSVMNGGTSMSVPTMNGTNMFVPSMNGTNQVVPMNGTNRVVPMNGVGGRYYMVSPVSLVEYDQVPMDWIPADLPEESKMYLRTAYMMGDKRALNGKLGDALKKIGTKVTQTVGNIVNTVAPVISQIPVVGKPIAAVSTIGINALNSKIAADQAKKQAAAAGLPVPMQKEAVKIAEDSSKALANIGIEADPQVLADRAVMAADMGVKSTGSGIFAFLDNLTPTQKVVGSVALAGLGYGAYRYFKKNKGKGGRKK